MLGGIHATCHSPASTTSWSIDRSRAFPGSRARYASTSARSSSQSASIDAGELVAGRPLLDDPVELPIELVALHEVQRVAARLPVVGDPPGPQQRRDPGQPQVLADVPRLQPDLLAGTFGQHPAPMRARASRSVRTMTRRSCSSTRSLTAVMRSRSSPAVSSSRRNVRRSSANVPTASAPARNP
jgi:hypothetical protein